MAKLKTTDYARLRSLCEGRRGAVTIGNNTVARLAEDGIVTVSLHGHDIVRLSADGDTAWTLAGWPTVTTRERVNQFLPDGQRVYQVAGQQRQAWAAFPGDRSSWRPVDADRWYTVSEHRYTDQAAGVSS